MKSEFFIEHGYWYELLRPIDVFGAGLKIRVLKADFWCVPYDGKSGFFILAVEALIYLENGRDSKIIQNIDAYFKRLEAFDRKEAMREYKLKRSRSPLPLP